MNHKAVVEIGVVLRPVSVSAVAEIPRLMFSKRKVDPPPIPENPEAAKERLIQRSKQQPVV